MQGGSNMTGTDLCVRLYKSVPVKFERCCTLKIWQKFTHFETRQTNPNYVCEQIKISLHSRDSCCPSFQDLVTFLLL